VSTGSQLCELMWDPVGTAFSLELVSNLLLVLAGRDRNDFAQRSLSTPRIRAPRVRFAAALARRETLRSADTSSREPSRCLYLWIAGSPVWPADGCRWPATAKRFVFSAVSAFSARDPRRSPRDQVVKRL